MKVENMNFNNITKKHLLRCGYETLEDLTKMKYSKLMNDKTTFNTIVNKVHQYGALMEFEKPYYVVIVKRLKNKEHVNLNELLISAHTVTALNRLGINYVEELAFFNEDMYYTMKTGEVKEVEFIIDFFGIKKESDKKIIKNIDVDMSEKTTLELKALHINNIKEYVYSSDQVKQYLSDDCRKELDDMVEYLYSNNGAKPVEIEVGDVELEVKKVQKTLKESNRLKDRLEELKRNKRMYEELLKESKKELKMTLTSAQKFLDN